MVSQLWQQRGVRGVDVSLAELLFLLPLLLWKVVKKKSSSVTRVTCDLVSPR
jgi:hypothetical protein